MDKEKRRALEKGATSRDRKGVSSAKLPVSGSDGESDNDDDDVDFERGSIVPRKLHFGVEEKDIVEEVKTASERKE